MQNEILRLKEIIDKYERIVKDGAIDKDEERHYIQGIHRRTIYGIQECGTVKQIEGFIIHYLKDMEIIKE